MSAASSPGRPVHFAGANPDPALATERYNEALTRFGFPEIHFVYEPVAAAFYFAQNLKADATVLVADFGGGTTDYSIIRFETSGGKLSATPIGHSGVGVAGDHFDYRMIDQIVAPQIGKGSLFRSFDKTLEVPASWYANFGRWNQLSIFKTSKEFAALKKLVRDSLEPEKLEIFVDLVDHDEGYPLYQAVSATKIALSSADEAEFNFAPLGRGGHKTIRRADFENWIEGDLARIEGALDDVLEKTNTSARADRQDIPHWRARLSSRQSGASSPSGSITIASRVAANCSRSPMALRSSASATTSCNGPPRVKFLEG